MATVAFEPIVRHAWVRLNDKTPFVDRDPIAISKSRGEQIEWFPPSTAREARIITFVETPFQTNRFEVPINGSVCSGAALKTAVIGKTYKYKICKPDGTLIVDPQVVIRE